MKKHIKNNLMRLALASIAISGMLALQNCGHDDHDDHDHEGELINSVKLEVVNKAGIIVGTYVWEDKDGDGGNAPNRMDTVRLMKDSSYVINTQFWNTTDGKNENVTTDIDRSKNEHLVCFTDNNSGITITYMDSDGTHPVGLKTGWKVGSTAQKGTLRVNLRHQPGVKNGQCNVGESDIDVVFPYEIK